MYLLLSKNYFHFTKKLSASLAIFLVFSFSIVKAQNSNLHYASGEASEVTDEKFSTELDSINIFNVVALKTGATTSDMDLFSNYYRDTLYKDRNDFYNKIGKTINTSSDIQQYANGKINEYVILFQKLQEIKKNYPNTVAEYSIPHKPHATTGVCNPSCSNIGFESGDLSGWDAYAADNNSTATVMSYTGAVGGACGAVTQAGLDVTTNKYKKNTDYQVQITSGAGVDPIAGALIPIVAPGGGKYSCRLGDTSVGGSRVGIIDQTFQVTAGNTALNYMYAVLIDQAPSGHTFGQAPHFIVTITDQTTGDTLPCGVYIVFSNPGMPGYTAINYKIPAYGWFDSIYCKPWTSVFVSLQNYVGHCVNVQAIVSDCFPTAIGPHFCYVYFDATCGPLSIITSTPSVCGGNVNMTAPAGGRYVWTGPCIVGNDTLQTVSASCSGTYTVTITSADGCTDTLQKVITVTPTMSVTATSTNAGCGITGSATATVTGGTGPYVYGWSNGTTTAKDTGLVAGNYTCTVSASGCVDTVKVTITGSGMTATQSAINPKCYDSTGSASVTPNGGKSPYTYSWNTGSTNQTLSGVMAGTYTCVIKDAGGCSFSQSVIITAPTALTIKATTFPATCSYLCNGQAIIVPKGGTNPYNYKWSNGATVASISNLCVGTTYTITVTDAHGCPHDTTINIANPPPIVLTTSNTPSLCNKPDGSASVVASGGTPGYTYLWNTGATATSAALNNITSGNYCVLILDANKCRDSACVNVPDIPGDSIKIVAITNVSCNGGNNGSAIASANGGTTPYTYLWSPSGGATTTANSLTAGTYTIIVTDNNGCKNIAVATITQPPPVIVATPPDTICIGQTATLTAAGSGGTPGYTYLWNSITPGTTYSVSPLTTTNYNVQATDANGCTSPVVPVTVVVRSPLVVVAGPPTNMCAGGSVTLSATGKGGDGTYNYTWSPSTGLNTTTGTTIIASPTVSTTYTVTLTDGCGTPQAQNTVAVIINPSPVVNLIADTLQGCYPLCVKFTDQSTVTGGNIVGWHWTFGDGDTSSNQNPNHCYTKPGVFTVSLSVTSNNGCKSSKIINNYITAYSHPVANFSLSPQPTNIMNSTIYFADHSTDAYGIANWFWQFGDGSDSSGVVKNPQHTYKDTGKYCVNLEVTNVHGCVDTTVQCLEIQPFFVIYVPNAFTPNGNGLNETFTAKGVGILTYEMWIFDRWGQQIYHCNDIYNGWDGKVQNGASGQIAQEDTYVWLIEVTDVLHKNHRYIGRVTLIK